ncbi:hypothetical protein Taro_002933 [Colocasia esculenta]|uniref:Uncharacterized protein n=1 Tax=Colocasia esculenta TaxID=4460 RepID=A0A843THY6_COLES|nr:hypothetical protein [Colocasia esculenta]
MGRVAIEGEPGNVSKGAGALLTHRGPHSCPLCLASHGALLQASGEVAATAQNGSAPGDVSWSDCQPLGGLRGAKTFEI